VNLHGSKGDVVNELVDTTWQYAVIAVRTEPDRERLIIAYPNEKTLRDLIAAPSIEALGYRSREEALANIDRGVLITAASRQKSIAAIADTSITLLKELGAGTRRLVGSVGSLGTQGAIRNLLQNGVAAAVLFLYSRNLLSFTVRAFISF
jgi:hypothetical protein